MRHKVGAITIGQSPRLDVVPEMRIFINESIEILQKGALDGLTLEEIQKFKPKDNDYVLVSKLNDGSSVKFGESHIIPLLQKCIDDLTEQGVELIFFLCTGKFPETLISKVPILYPNDILHAIVPVISPNRKIGVINPEIDQIQQCHEKWSSSGCTVQAVAGSPYRDISEVRTAAEKLVEMDVDVIVMDCIGYNLEMKNIVMSVTNKPVVLSRSILARVVDEMFTS